MAYKFQRGSATLSGSLTAEDGLAGTLGVADLDIDGATDIGADLADADLLVVDDGAGGTNRKTTLTRVKKYIYSAVSGDATVSDAGALTIAANAVEDSMLNDNVAAGLAGAAINASSGVLSLNANPDSFSVSDGDGLALSSSVAGAGLALAGGALSVDIDELAALGGASLHQTQDHFMFSDNGTEKKITFSNLEDSIFANVSGDATIAAGGALTIANDAVQAAMLNDDIISGQTEMTGDVADTDEILISDAGTVKRADFSVLRDAVFNDVSGDATIAAGGALTIAANAVEGSMLNSNAAGAGINYGSNKLSLNVNPDSFSLADGDGLALSSSVAGAGIALAGGALSLDIDELSALGGTGLHQTQDHFVFSDNGTEKKITFSNLQDAIFADVSGDATVAAGGALTIAADAVEGSMLNDNVISGQTELAHADIADADELMISDGGTLKKVGVDSLQNHYFAAISGDATVADGGALTIANGAVENDMLAGSIANGKLVNSAITIAGTSVSLGGAITAFTGITDLDAAAGDLTIFDTANANQTLTIGASNGKVKIAGDLQVVGSVETVNATQLRVEDMLIVTARSASTNAAINGAGIQFGDGTNNNGGAFLFKNDSTYGQLLDAVDGDHSGSIDIRAASFIGDLVGSVNNVVTNLAASTALRTLSAGITTFASASVPQSASLPATPETGSVIHVKAEASCDSTRFVKIQSHASHSQKIDGEDFIILESPFAGVSLMYTGANKWIIL